MANSRSALKQIRVSQHKAAYNKKIKSRTKTAIKKVALAVDAGDMQIANEALLHAVSSIDKATTKGIYHKKTASRKKSRLTKMVNRASA